MTIYKQEITYKDSKIKILVDKKPLIKTAFDELVKQRTEIEKYIEKDNFFKSSLGPIKTAKAPKIAEEMALGAEIANTGPMAAVAGTISEFVCRKLIKEGAETAIVENGGDIYAITKNPVIIGLFAGKNSLAGKIAFRLDKNNTPIAVCSSSSKLGHSISFGRCDLATVFSKKAAVADAAATQLANKIKEEHDIGPRLKEIAKLRGVDGALAIKNKKIGFIGKLPPLIRTDDNKIEEKVTRF